MADKKEHIIYSKADIENYLQGNMSKDAMHSMERAALQDAFLADAIEGYSFADAATSANHLAEIESLISLNKQETKIVTLKKKSEWLKIAVAVVLFAGLGWISALLMNDGSKKKSIVNNENINNIPTSKEAEKMPAIASDSVVPKNDIAIIEEKANKQQYKSLDKNTNANGTIATNRSSVTLGIVSPLKQEEDKLDDTKKSIVQSDVSANATSIASNQATFSNKNAGPSVSNNATYNYSPLNTNAAEITSKEVATKKADLKDEDKVNTDSKAKYVANSNASVVNLPTIRVKRDSTVESIPVTGYFSKKQAAKPVTFKLSKEDSLSVPVNGWDAFNNYLQKNSAYKTITYDTAFTPVTITNQKTGEEIVGLEFDIDTNGKPQKIKVTKSVDEETDAKAIELLKNGPKWQASKKKAKGKVAIKF